MPKGVYLDDMQERRNWKRCGVFILYLKFGGIVMKFRLVVFSMPPINNVGITRNRNMRRNFFFNISFCFWSFFFFQNYLFTFFRLGLFVCLFVCFFTLF